MNRITLETGQIIEVHDVAECAGSGPVLPGSPAAWCAIHNPMPGPWRDWPRLWHEDAGIMERVCPCGIGHPVAEMYEWAVASGKGHLLVHGCCFEHTCSPRVTKRTVQTADPRGDWPMGYPDADTEVIPKVTDEIPIFSDTEHEYVEVMIDAMRLMIDLWPDPGYATVTLESHQWQQLRRILRVMPELVGEVLRK